MKVLGKSGKHPEKFQLRKTILQGESLFFMYTMINVLLAKGCRMGKQTAAFLFLERQ
jgi:hypothetical protein